MEELNDVHERTLIVTMIMLFFNIAGVIILFMVPDRARALPMGCNVLSVLA